VSSGQSASTSDKTQIQDRNSLSRITQTTHRTLLRYSRAMARRRGMLGDPGGLFGLDGLRGFRSGAACCTVKVCRKSATSDADD